MFMNYYTRLTSSTRAADVERHSASGQANIEQIPPSTSVEPTTNVGVDCLEWTAGNDWRKSEKVVNGSWS